MRTFNQWAKAAGGDKPKPMTEVSAIFRAASDRQIAVSDGTMEEHTDKTTGEITDREKLTWLPKSQISVDEVDNLANLEKGKVYTVRLPEWLAKDRGAHLGHGPRARHRSGGSQPRAGGSLCGPGPEYL